MTRRDELDVAYFAQHQLDELHPDDSAYAHLRRTDARCAGGKVRARAGAIGFPQATADTPVGQPLGRREGAPVAGPRHFGGPHLLVLDEPTNHLDIDSRAALIEAINYYPGAVILVSHDRICSSLRRRLMLVADGRVTPFDGDLDDYRRLVLAERGATGMSAERRKAGTPRAGRADIRRAAGGSASSSRPCAGGSQTRKRPSPGSMRRSRGSMRPLPAPACLRAIRKAAALAKARADHASALAQGGGGLARSERTPGIRHEGSIIGRATLGAVPAH